MIGLSLLIVLIASLQGEITSAQGASSSQGQHADIVTGTLEELDLTRMKGMIKTDLGKPVFFEVTQPQLFKGLSVGERVTIELDDRGRANKVIDASVPELKQPLTPGQ
jgi:hypothetical protein